MGSKIGSIGRGGRSLPNIVEGIAATYRDKRLQLQHLGETPFPNESVVVEVLGKIRKILFPGYFGQVPDIEHGVEQYVGELVDEVYRRLSQEICKALRVESGPEPGGRRE